MRNREFYPPNPGLLPIAPTQLSPGGQGHPAHQLHTVTTCNVWRCYMISYSINVVVCCFFVGGGLQ